MEINLINGYYIEVDEFNHTLKKKYTGTNVKTGEPKEAVKICGYYNTLEGALEGFLKRNQVDVMAKLSLDLREYVKMVEECNKAAVQALKSIVEGSMKNE